MTAVQVNDFLDDCKPKTVSCGSMGQIPLIEFIEDMLLSLIPANAIIHAVAGTTGVSAQLPVTSAILLIVLSVILTLIGGLIPSKKAAKKDPVTALRTE